MVVEHIAIMDNTTRKMDYQYNLKLKQQELNQFPFYLILNQITPTSHHHKLTKTKHKHPKKKVVPQQYC